MDIGVAGEELRHVGPSIWKKITFWDHLGDVDVILHAAHERLCRPLNHFQADFWRFLHRTLAMPLRTEYSFSDSVTKFIQILRYRPTAT